MTDVSVALQTAIVAALKNDAGVTAIAGERVYDRVPEKKPKPYVNYGGEQVLPDDVDCIAGFEAFVTLHGWSDAAGQIEAKRLAGAVRNRLHNTDLAVADHRLHLIEHRGTDYLDDPDGLTTHAVIVFRVLLDPLA